ncbi:hypothetical protein [Xylophilus ampelinus]|uniref:TspB protein n=1 Tax=Xylophilus ampelinus TaxID=54067 RepID=A0A318SP81_9BURK|nr:hypothetical protein [Xylophilus ampelinus]MCS4511880.1 hypothetical protein [Xylophilus ampelinus]PYE73018.1 hypothetical protein DFQ15_1416 [Xylophilus ampelinus]
MNRWLLLLALPLIAACIAPRAHAAGTFSRTTMDGVEYVITGNSATMRPTGRSSGFGDTGPTTGTGRMPGTPVGSPSAGGFGLAKAEGGIAASTRGKLPLASKIGAAIDVTVKHKISAKSIAKVLTTPGGVIGQLVLGYGIKQLLDEACVRLMGGTLQMNAAQTWEECVRKEGGIPSTMYYSGGKWYSDPLAACQAYVPSSNGYVRRGSSIMCTRNSQYLVPVDERLVCPDSSDPSGFSQVDPGTSCPGGGEITWRSTEPDSVADKIESAIPESNSLPDVAREILGNGGELPVDGTEVTGPATGTPTEAEKKDETTNPDPQPGNPNATSKTETTTKEKTTDKYNYDKDKVTRSEDKQTETCTKTTSGAGVTTVGCSNTSTTTQNPKTDDTPPTDTDLPEVPELYKQKYPEGMTGVWNKRKDELKGTKIIAAIPKFMPPVSWAGGCPGPMYITLDVGIVNFGQFDASPPCNVWTFCGVVIVISALLLARSLVFGG